jgi:predicted nucleic acid-binding protein
MDAFDSDVLIYAAAPDHPLGRRVRRLFSAAQGRRVGIGSVVLLPEVLAKPLRNGTTAEIVEITKLLGRLELRPADAATAEIAASLAALHRLRAVDAFHLATAVVAHADRFITNNRKDLGPSITEIEVAYPDDLPEP